VVGESRRGVEKSPIFFGDSNFGENDKELF
jgi:hypothetical protein